MSYRRETNADEGSKWKKLGKVMAELKTQTVAAYFHCKQTLQGERWILPEE